VLHTSAVVALIAALAGPTAYTVQTVTTAHTGGVVTAGPTVSGGTGGLPGGLPSGLPSGMPSGLPSGMPSMGAMGDSTPSAEITALLLADADSYTWVAATVSANSAAGYQLATEKSVMPIGGFSGSDPSPTLDEFKAYVAAGDIHYFIGGSGFGQAGGGFGQAGGGSSSSSEISAWVTATYAAQTVGEVTVYDLTQPAT